MILEHARGHRRIAVVGLAKNAGKTTVLNALVAEAAAAGLRVGICSIGRDGEKTDALTRLPKPRVVLPPCALCITTDRLAAAATVAKAAANAAAANTAAPGGLQCVQPLFEEGMLGRPGIWQNASDSDSLELEIAGVNRISRMKQALDVLEGLCDLIVLDGALDRRSSGIPGLASGIILCTGGAVGNSIELVVERTLHAVELLQLPVLETGPADGAEVGTPGSALNNDLILIPGALTPRRLYAILDKRHGGAYGPGNHPGLTRIAVQDWTRIFLSSQDLAYLRSVGAGLYLERRLPLLAVCSNPFNPLGCHLDAADLRTALRSGLAALPGENTPVPCVDIRLDEEAPQ